VSREHALRYAAAGWPVFPLRPAVVGDKDSGKRPLTPNGLRDATTNVNVIERWWDRWPDANIGVPTGSAIGAFVVDVDGPQGAASLTQLEEELGPLPDTKESRTGGGGRHLFFAWPNDREVRNKQDLLKGGSGIDVRGEGGYVVVPPSLHWSGRRYEWPHDDEREPAMPAPRAWLDKACPGEKVVPPWERMDPPEREKVAPPPASGLAVVRRPVFDRARLYLGECDPAVAGHGGHNRLLWAARSLVVGFELSDDEAVALLWSDYNPRCQPPWDQDDEKDRRDFERKVGEARRTPGSKPVGWLLDEFGLRSTTAAMVRIANGAASAAALLASHAKRAVEQPETPPALEPREDPEPAGPRRDFPIDMLPASVRAFCLAISESHNVDLSFAALPILCVAGAAMGNAWRLQLKRGFVVPPILWVGLVSPSGTNKSGPLNEIVAPLRDVITVDMITDHMLNPQGRMVVSDATLEAVVARLVDSRRGLLVYRDELAAWVKSFNAYKKGAGADEQAWLEFWGGKDYTVDRKTANEQLHIPAASCAILGGIQPKILVECFDPAKFASGLVPRILIACPPRRQMWWNEEEVDPEAEARWADTVRFLRLTPFCGLDTNSGRFVPRVSVLTTRAKAAFVGFFDALTAEAEDLTDENAQAVFSKARVQAARLTLIHHGLRLACGSRDLDEPVDLESAEAGIAWGRWCLEEQLRVYGFGSVGYRQKRAAELVVSIRAKCPTGSATVRQVQRTNNTRYKSAQAARADMASVVELGLGRWADETRDKVILNPAGVVA